jgi:hypothetical protein
LSRENSSTQRYAPSLLSKPNAIEGIARTNKHHATFFTANPSFDKRRKYRAKSKGMGLGNFAATIFL